MSSRRGLSFIIIVCFAIAGLGLYGWFGTDLGSFASEKKDVKVVKGDEKADTEKGELVITVIDDQESVIEDGKTPLAAEPGDSDRGAIHVGIAGLLLLMVIGYVTYFGRFERRLLALKREVAKAEKQAVSCEE